MASYTSAWISSVRTTLPHKVTIKSRTSEIPGRIGLVEEFRNAPLVAVGDVIHCENAIDGGDISNRLYIVKKINKSSLTVIPCDIDGRFHSGTKAHNLKDMFVAVVTK